MEHPKTGHVAGETLRQEASVSPAFTPTRVRQVTDQLRGRSFSQLSPVEKEDLLMVIGCQLGLIAPEDPQH